MSKKRFLVYFWLTEDRQILKTGHCQGNLYLKRADIRYGCPSLCEYPAGVIVCKDKKSMLKTERTMHRQFKKHRTGGEWFTLTDEISAYIQEFTDTEAGKRFLEEDRERERKRKRSPEYRKYQREYHRKRYHNDPDFREHILKADRKRKQKRRQNDREYRERMQERERKYWRKRYYNNLEYRECEKERNQKYRQKRYQNDPEYREYQKKYQREYRARKKREALLENGQQLSLF